MKMLDVIHLTLENSGVYKLDRESTIKSAQAMLKQEITISDPEYLKLVTDNFMHEVDMYLLPRPIDALAILIKRDHPDHIHLVVVDQKAKKKRLPDVPAIDYTQTINAANEVKQPVEIGEMHRVTFVNAQPPTPAIVDDLTKPEES